MGTIDLQTESLSQFTPAMRQFVEIKRRYPEQLVLFRMGDFYETFFDDASKANRLIGITLTKRGKMSDGTPIPMAGIPMVSLDQYVARLVKMGESVVIAEQQGVPGKGPAMERKISRIITPGTLTETALLPEKSDSVLLAVAAPKRRRKGDAGYGFVWLTLSSGDFRAENVSAEQFETELARIAPSEILVPEHLKQTLRETHPELVLTSMPDWHFDAAHGAENLKKVFGLDNLDAWEIEDFPLVLEAANALLDYTSETQVDALPFIRPLKLVTENEFIVIDPASRRNLEISDTVRRDAGELTLFSVLDGCRSAMGSRELKRWLNQPLRGADAARARHDAIERLVTDADDRARLSEELDALPDIERIASRIALGSVRPRELASLRDALPAVRALGAAFSDSPATLLADLSRTLEVPEAIETLLREALLEEPAVQLRDGDVIASTFNTELKTLRDLRDNTGQFLLDLEARERQATGLSTLRVEFNKVHGFYIEVSKAQSKDVPLHYHRRQTLKNTERYITPELKSYEDKALSAKERSSALERELYLEVVARLQPEVARLMEAASALSQFDALLALAEHAIEYRWVKPRLTDRTGLSIEGGRHPVVETAIENYVPNDCRLDENRRMLVITGPNMGGKSTYMRSVALIVLLAWAGSFVPAASAEIGPVDRIHTRIGASDDLARGRSTFLVERTEAATILHQATDRSLVLMDEIGRGTSTYDGLSLAAAIAQSLVEDARAYTLFATHYFELTKFAEELRGVANVHVAATQAKSRVVFLHEITEGPANRSYGIAVAQLAGVPPKVVRRAREVLRDLEAGKMPGMQPSLFDLPHDPLLDAPASDDEFGEDAFDAKAPGLTAEDLRPFLDRVEALCATDLDSLTPRAALELLYGTLPALKSALEETEARFEASDESGV